MRTIYFFIICFVRQARMFLIQINLCQKSIYYDLIDLTVLGNTTENAVIRTGQI